jgi:hypothetical protein
MKAQFCQSFNWQQEWTRPERLSSFSFIFTQDSCCLWIKLGQMLSMDVFLVDLREAETVDRGVLIRPYSKLGATFTSNPETYSQDHLE